MADHRSNRAGFTLIEMLVVMAIIAILAGMILAGIKVFDRQGPKTKTETITRIIATGLAQRSAQLGGEAFALHPFARYAYGKADSGGERALFTRGEDTPAFAAGQPVATEGMGLRTADLRHVDSDEEYVMHPTDVFEGAAVQGDVPLLYGVHRFKLHTIGTSWRMTEHKWVGPQGVNAEPEKQFMRYDRPVLNYSQASAITGDGKVEARYEDKEPALTERFDTPVFEQRSAEAVTAMLGDIEDDLRKLGVIHHQDFDANADTLLHGVRIAAGAEQRGDFPRADQKVKGSFIKDGSTWKRYRLRGTGLYDAWGRELLIFRGRENTGLVVASAGRDGVFMVHPGYDNTFQTDPLDDPLAGAAVAGDDRDGTTDNVIHGAWE